MSRKNTRDKINGAFKRHVLVFLRFKTLKTLLTPLEGGGEPKGKREIRLIFFVFLLLFYTFHRLNTRCALVRPRSFIRAKIFFFVSRIVRIPLAKVETFHCYNENYDHVSPRDDFETKLPAVKRDYNDSTITHSSHV